MTLTGSPPDFDRREPIPGYTTSVPDLTNLPKAQRPVIARALSKEPAQRYESCLAMIEALKAAAADNAPAPSPESSPAGRAATSGGKHRPNSARRPTSAAARPARRNRRTAGDGTSRPTIKIETRRTAPPSGSSRRGAVLILTALMTTMLLGLLAFAIDLGFVRIALSELQTAADAGALAGARGLTVCCTSTALSDAQRAAQLNYVFQTPVSVVPSEDIELGTWDETTSTFTALAGSAVSNANAMRVTCRLSAARGNALPLYFARILGINSQDLSAAAVARSTPIMCGAFIGLNSVSISGGSSTDSYDSSAGAYNAATAGNKGTVCSNGEISLSGGATVNGDAHPGPGYSLSASGGASVTGTTAALSKLLSEAAVDPGDVANTNDNSTIPLSANGKDPLVSGNFSLSGGDKVTLLPGTYYFSTLSLWDNSSLEVTGKTIIYVAGEVDAGSGTLTNGTQIPSNLQLYATGSSITLNSGAQMHAVVYAPTADISLTGGNSDFFGMMVGASLTLCEGSGLHADTALTGTSSTTRKGALVQ